MKTIFLATSLIVLSLAGCKPEARLDLPKQNDHKNASPKVVSIDALKNGKHFINYLGTKMDDC